MKRFLNHPARASEPSNHLPIDSLCEAVISSGYVHVVDLSRSVCRGDLQEGNVRVVLSMKKCGCSKEPLLFMSGEAAIRVYLSDATTVEFELDPKCTKHSG